MPAQTSWLSQKTRLWLLIGAGLLLLVAANSHLVYVAMVSQPDCVAHLRQADDQRDIEHGRFRAAVSSCSLQ
jgi:hypothetical protein